MNLGKNLQFLRKLNHSMTQEELAERLEVSRQSVSRWEMDDAFPEMEKLLQLCDIFACTLDELVRGDFGVGGEAYSEVHFVTLPEFLCAVYTVISADPESDAIEKVRRFAKEQGIESPEIIGWDFPFLSQEQINVYHLHGYTAGCIVPRGTAFEGLPFLIQPERRWAVITIKEPQKAPFTLIPNGYKVLQRYLELNGIPHREWPDEIACFEKEYQKDGVGYMDIYILVD